MNLDDRDRGRLVAPQAWDDPPSSRLHSTLFWVSIAVAVLGTLSLVYALIQNPEMFALP